MLYATATQWHPFLLDLLQQTLLCLNLHSVCDDNSQHSSAGGFLGHSCIMQLEPN